MDVRGRAFALVVVLLASMLLTVLLVGIQATAFRQSIAGRETLGRLRAQWAARAGVEATLAGLESVLQAGSTGSAYAALDAMDRAWSGSVDGATWRVSHAEAGRAAESHDGPADPHAKININLMSRDDLLSLDGMTEEAADSILDWIDEDDEPRALGAETGYYSQLASPYEPRNGPVVSLFEIELASGVSPESVRGEDWNLDGVLDANEDDGDLSWPPDNADGVLDAGWSAFVTASSWEPPFAVSGRPRLNLATAESDAFIERVPSIDSLQARAILDFTSRGGARLEDLISTPLTQLVGAASGSGLRNLRDDQLRAIFDECAVGDLEEAPGPGRVNLNTVSRETLDSVTAISPGLADVLMLARDSSGSGLTNVMDLREVSAMTPTRIRGVSEYLSVDSGSYVVAATGRDSATGIEARIVWVIRTGVLPAPIVEQRVR